MSKNLCCCYSQSYSIFGNNISNLRQLSFIQNSVLLHVQLDFFPTFNLYVVKYQIYCRDGSILPTFYQRDDSLALHDVISNYVSKYVSLYYGLFDFITTISYSSTLQCHKVTFPLYTFTPSFGFIPNLRFLCGSRKCFQRGSERYLCVAWGRGSRHT